jgi:hypothetical protein
MKQRRVCSMVISLAVLLGVEISTAQETPLIGDARNALPGLYRVPAIGLVTTPRVSAALDTGYGITESLSSEGTHHRMLGSMAFGLVPLPGLELGMLGGLRYDRHPKDALGRDSGTMGHLSLVARTGTQIARRLWVGAELGATFPGSERWVDSLKSPALDLRTACGWFPVNGFRYAGFVGFRFDNTAHVGSFASEYRAGDRIALGVSEFNAILVGAGVVAPLGRFELFGELSGDMLVGNGAPSIKQSPLRADVGVRRALSTRFCVELLGETSLSSRPAVTPHAALIPIEPRFVVALGVRYQLGIGSSIKRKSSAFAEPFVASKLEVKPPATPPVATAQVTGQMSVLVLDSSGHPLSDATVKFVSAVGEQVLEFEQGSTYVADAVPLGLGKLIVQANWMRDWERQVEVTSDQVLEVRVEMTNAERFGQIRGHVRAFDGTNLPAMVRVEPVQRDVQANPDGTFDLDIEPGTYSVRVTLDGYQTQLRTVTVRENGVIVLNVDLERGK